MSIIANGASIGKVMFNGTDCETVYMNGTIVFQKAPPASEHVLGVGVRGYAAKASRGYLSGAFGSLAPDVSSVLGSINSLAWDEIYSPASYQIAINTEVEAARIRVTIGGTPFVLLSNYYPAKSTVSLLYISQAQYAAIPATGNVAIKIEVLE